VAEMRRNIPAATQAALWALSSGRCYAPGCPYPVVVEIRAGVYRKNAQIGHIYGVRPGAARFSSQIPDEVRDSFTNLLLLCLPHHGEVDDKKTGAKLYPPKTLREWKIRHEGSNGPALAVLGQVDEDSIAELLTGAFSPPIERLQSIARQLEQTGTLNAAAVQELPAPTSSGPRRRPQGRRRRRQGPRRCRLVAAAVVVVPAAAEAAEQTLPGTSRGLGHPADRADERVRRPAPRVLV
jgi:hypothetical protein